MCPHVFVCAPVCATIRPLRAHVCPCVSEIIIIIILLPYIIIIIIIIIIYYNNINNNILYNNK